MTVIGWAIESIRARRLMLIAMFGALSFVAAIAGAHYAISAIYLSIAALLVVWHASTSWQSLYPTRTRLGTSLKTLSVQQWLSFQEAIESFCDSTLARARADAALETNKIMLDLLADQRVSAAALKKMEAARSSARKKQEQATQALEQHLREMLASGVLVARGLIASDGAVTTRTIQPDEWPDAQIDLSAGTVRTRTHDYSDVLIGEPRFG